MLSNGGAADRSAPVTATGGRLRLVLVSAAVGATVLAASCGGGSSAAQPDDTIPGSPPDHVPSESTASTTTSPAAPPTESTAGTSATTTPSTGTATDEDEGQDTPTIIDWTIDVDAAECRVSDLPGSPGGEAVVPASWAAGNAEYVDFIVDGDLRPANTVRDVRGTGNIQVPCDPELNDGHEVIIVAYAGPPADPGIPVEGSRLIVTTTATVDNGG